MDRMNHLSPVTLAALLALFAALGCGRDRARVVEQRENPFARELEEAVPRIEGAVGLQFRQPPVVEARSRDEVREFLIRRLREERTQEELRGTQLLYVRLGLIPATMNLEAFLIELLQEQVVGYYDPTTKVLYVVEGAAREQASTVLYHELVHALQDQYLDLDSLQRMEGNSDRQVSAQAVIEGQATLKSMEAMLGDDLMARLPGGWDRVRQMIREQSASMPIFAGAPFVLQEQLIFPYLNGAEFVRRFDEQRPNESLLGDAMPTATSHILRPDTYFGAQRVQPLDLTLPSSREGRLVLENNMGEFMIRLFLFDHLRNQPEAIRAATGWRGDRYQVTESDAGDAFMWITVWDRDADADEFAASLARYPQRRYRDATEATGQPAGTRRFAAEGRTLLLQRTEVAGFPAVYFVDVPSSIRTDLIDLGGVRVR